MRSRCCNALAENSKPEKAKQELKKLPFIDRKKLEGLDAARVSNYYSARYCAERFARFNMQALIFKN